MTSNRHVYGARFFSLAVEQMRTGELFISGDCVGWRAGQ